MEYKRFKDTYVVRIDSGEEIVVSLLKLAAENGIRLAEVSGLGATNDFTVGVYDMAAQAFMPNRFTGDHEIVSLVGTLNTMDSKPYIHLHMSAGNRQGQVVGGHLKSAVISATCEVVVRVIDGVVDRKVDPATGLNLFAF